MPKYPCGHCENEVKEEENSMECDYLQKIVSHYMREYKTCRLRQIDHPQIYRPITLVPGTARDAIPNGKMY